MKYIRWTTFAVLIAALHLTAGAEEMPYQVDQQNVRVVANFRHPAQETANMLVTLLKEDGFSPRREVLQAGILVFADGAGPSIKATKQYKGDTVVRYGISVVPSGDGCTVRVSMQMSTLGRDKRGKDKMFDVTHDNSELALSLELGILERLGQRLPATGLPATGLPATGLPANE
ncbi:hypothetical protein H8L32_22855 [Undibacterium sp. CY18W]|uniref:DUF4410 domain-containing protein n=1 Tax=Undibacterium hunanense TaxID=2762292 RepID=A0ABR6ZWR6_9BURK|nr:hypothetical protein [Undibacterium hunanense]MBC3920322.1 hypothetical protein [Undibacterium hunanense]